MCLQPYGMTVNFRLLNKPFCLMSITQNKMTYIMVPHSGGSCELSDGSEVFGSDSCYGVATWDDYHSAFRSIDNQIQLSELSPQ